MKRPKSPAPPPAPKQDFGFPRVFHVQTLKIGNSITAIATPREELFDDHDEATDLSPTKRSPS